MSLESTVVRTKLSAPVSRSADIPRSRLIHELREQQLPRLTSVCAPAGFGKSTLLGQWHHDLQDRGIRTCWLSLDESDRDPKRFAYHLIAACRLVVVNAGADALPHLDNTIEPDLSMLLAPLINDLTVIERPMCLFLDDYHFVASSAINDFMELFLNLVPPRLHVIIASRVALPLPLAPLRLRGDLIEFNTSDLRFDSNESTLFLGSDNAGHLSRDEALALDKLAEGWPAGLQLALLSMRDPQRKQLAPLDFNHSLRDVADYLVTEVLAQLPNELREFMLRTAVLSRMNAGACEAISGESDAQSILERMEAQNLFLIPLDQTGGWYRYHHLFHELLLAQLRREHPAEIVKLYGAAADWFRDANLPDESFEYALLSGDEQRIVHLVTHYFRSSIGAGKAPQVLAWCDKLPAALKNAYPIVLAIEATALFHMRGHERAKGLLKTLEQVDPESVPSPAELDYYLRSIRAGIAMSQDDVETALIPLQKDFANIGDYSVGTVNNIAGYCLAEIGNFEEAKKRLETARYRHQRHGAPFGIAYSDCFMALIHYETGELEQALVCVERSRNAIEGLPDSYALPVPAATLGIVFCEQNQLEQAQSLLRANLSLLEKVGHINLVTRGYVALARIHAARGDSQMALQTLEHARSLLPGSSAGRLRTLSIIEQLVATIAVKQNSPAMISNALARLGVEPGTTITAPDIWERVTSTRALLQARLSLLQGEGAQAMAIAQALAQSAANAGRQQFRLEAILIGAAAAQSLALSNDQETLSRQAITLAETTGMCRTLAESPQMLIPTLNALAQASEDARIKEVFRELSQDQSKLPARFTAENLSSPISDREQEILALMADGCANPLIAQRLGISENTVKWHAKNIYAKLNASNRTEAVVLARQGSLISSHSE